MKKGISQWMFPADTPLEECFQQARRAGFDGVEVALGERGELSLDTTREQAQAVRRAADRAGIEISGLATGLYWKWSFTAEDPATREQAMAVARRQIEIAAWLGVDAILVVPGAIDVFFDPSQPIIDYAVAYERAGEALRQLAPYAERNRVMVGIENVWNKFLLSPLEFRRFIDEVGNSWIKAYFDVGNVVVYGYPQHWIRILERRICRVHVKDFKRNVGTAEGFVGLLAGDVDWPAVVDALVAVGYDGYLTAEIAPPRFWPESILEETSRAMDWILGKRAIR